MASAGERSVTGTAVVSPQPLTFLGFLNRRTGLVEQRGHPLFGESVAGKILVFPRGIGSTVGPYVLLEMQTNGVAPIGMVMHRGDLGTIAAASVARIPLVYDVEPDPTKRFKSGEVLLLRSRGG
ncbi:MAG TPA: DUF126 domain-containing protein, partial [Thermoplasmata archaeon]|nr:DUF126 domain-containing protein [Thermoplasmata archaeon]